MLASHNGSLSTVLIAPTKEKTEKPLPKKSYGQILTSKDSIKAMEEKEQMKKEKIRLKEECKHKLEKRRQEKVELATKKKYQREAKGIEKAKERKHTRGPKKTNEQQLEKNDKTADSRRNCGEGSIPSFTERDKAV